MKAFVPYIIVFVAGIFCGALIYMNIIKQDAPVEKIVKSLTAQTTTESKIVPGIPDTMNVIKNQSAKVKIKLNGINEFPADNKDLSITKVTVSNKKDSAEVEVEAKVSEKTITKIDTVYSSTTIQNSENIIKEVVKESEWQLSIGTGQFWNDEIDLYKYSEISYNKKVWFFYLKGIAGIHNQLNNALSNLKIHTKLELNVPLN